MYNCCDDTVHYQRRKCSTSPAAGVQPERYIHLNGTNPRLASVILAEDDYLYLFTKGDYKCAEAAEQYSEKSELGLAFAYFTDVVFCNSVNYTEILTSEFGSEQLLIDEDTGVFSNPLNPTEVKKKIAN